jgi:predicted dehydrogenase
LSEKPIRVAVVGVGDFGRNHVRVWREIEGAELVGIIDTNAERAQKVAAEFGTRVLRDLDALTSDGIDAVSLAVPTAEHARIGSRILAAGIDVLVEKPIAASLDEADALITAAKRSRGILQVGHVERFNPAVVAVGKIVSRPMFFEVHRLGIFSPRSLDIDVVYDVMIHDLDILLSLVNAPVVDLKAVGIPVISDKVDIAHARVEFETGTVANLTASRVSTERVRKMRFFQEHEYVSLDFTRQDVLRVRVEASNAKAASAMNPEENNAQPKIGFEKVPTTPEEPLRAELRSFLESVRTRTQPIVDGAAGRRALELADRVMSGILEHARHVQLSSFVPQDAR